MSPQRVQLEYDTVGTRGPISRCGVGLREPHLEHILKTKPDVAWFELLTDNYLQPNGPLWRQIDRVRGNYSMTFHGVGMSLGSVEPLDNTYLENLGQLMKRFEPAWVSDHIAFTHIGEKYFHDLLPVPYNDEALEHLTQRILQVQDSLGSSLVVENVSSYLQYQDSTIAEAEFISELLSRTDCRLLLDVNNVYVNSINHGFNARDYLANIPYEKVVEIHLGGYDDRGDYLLDAHNNMVTPPVWQLYAEVMQFNHDIPTLIEWDNDLPDFEVLQDQATLANDIASQPSSILIGKSV